MQREKGAWGLDEQEKRRSSAIEFVVDDDDDLSEQGKEEVT